MELKELAITIKETLGLEVITLASLITCVNNCFADLHSRGYREYNEVTLSKDEAVAETLDAPAMSAYDITGAFPITFNTSLIEERVSGKVRTITYLKVLIDDTVYTVPRLNLTSNEYKGFKDEEGRYRADFRNLNEDIVYWQQRDTITIDSNRVGLVCDEVIVGFTETLARLPLNSLINQKVDVREELFVGLTLYGAYFYANKMRMDVELTKEYLNRYKYFVEDIQADLFKEDSYYASPMIEGGGIYE